MTTSQTSQGDEERSNSASASSPHEITGDPSQDDPSRTVTTQHGDQVTSGGSSDSNFSNREEDALTEQDQDQENPGPQLRSTDATTSDNSRQADGNTTTSGGESKQAARSDVSDTFFVDVETSTVPRVRLSTLGQSRHDCCADQFSAKHAGN